MFLLPFSHNKVFDIWWSKITYVRVTANERAANDFIAKDYISVLLNACIDISHDLTLSSSPT